VSNREERNQRIGERLRYANRLPAVAGRGWVVGMDWLFSGGVAAKDIDDGSVVNLLDFLYAVFDSLMKAVFL